MEYQEYLYIFILINIAAISASIGSQPLANCTEDIHSIEAKGLLSSAIDLSISGARFNDLNSNGIEDENEKGLAGTKIRLMQNGTEISITITNEYGRYSFFNLSPGEYTVIEEKVNGWNQSSPPGGSYDIILANASIENLNFGDTGGIFTDGPYEMMYFSPEQLQQSQKIHASLPKVSISPTTLMQIRQAAGEHFSLMNYLSYDPAERDQGSCGNCWVWAGTAPIEIDNKVRNSIDKRLSIQYFSSNYNGGAGCGFDCCGGLVPQVADFYNERKKVIPWENDKAHPFEDKIRCCSLACNNQGCNPGTTAVAANDIVEYPNYRIDSISCLQVNTIDEIKSLLKQKKAVTFSFRQNSGVAFQDYWRNRGESDVFNPGTWSGSWGHAVTCVGYDDTDPSNPYWIMLNSWGARANRLNGLFAVTMNLDYNLCQFHTFDINWRDDFGYTHRDSSDPNGPTFNWIEISGDGTEVLPGSDDLVVNDIPVGFAFNYYGKDYSRLAITNNGLLFSGEGSYNYVNQPIEQSNAVHGFIAPFWDDLVTWNSAGSIFYKTIGTEPNRMFIVEWKDNQHYHDSTEGVTFEAILYEGSNNILFQYLDTTFGTATYDFGRSATVGIESPEGNDGLQYSYNDPVINPGLAILFQFPPFLGATNIVALQTYNGQYLCAEGGGGEHVVANRNAIGGWETFKLLDLGNNMVALQAYNGQYLSAEGGGGDGVVANRFMVLGWEKFKLINLGNGKIALQSNNDQYLCAEGGGGGAVMANRNGIGSWETFKLIYQRPIAIQTYNGKYLCAEGGGNGAVVANRNGIGGWETFKLIDRGNGYVALQACNGQYVSAEGGGGDGVVANRNALYGWETFKLIDKGNGYFALQAANSQYLCAEGGGDGAVVANRNVIGDWEKFRFMDLQRPAKISLQAYNRRYFCAEDGGGGAVVANRFIAFGWETFKLIDRGDGYVALQASNGQYLCAEGGGGGAIVANRNGIGDWEKFRLIYMGDGYVALQASNGQYVCAEGGGGDGVVANRDWIAGWETFRLIPA
jgi:hypothetical protein